MGVPLWRPPAPVSPPPAKRQRTDSENSSAAPPLATGDLHHNRHTSSFLRQTSLRRHNAIYGNPRYNYRALRSANTRNRSISPQTTTTSSTSNADNTTRFQFGAFQRLLELERESSEQQRSQRQVHFNNPIVDSTDDPTASTGLQRQRDRIDSEQLFRLIYETESDDDCPSHS